MKQKVFESHRLGERYTQICHPSGLTLLLYPMAGFHNAFVSLTANYGSVDSRFQVNGQWVTVPQGIAHFLEHKLFESEEGDAFEQYAKTGADANAFTSFAQTSYLFTVTDHFKESFEILLNLVTKPYFTNETVQKELGIIEQEIEMYQDSPDWQVLFQLLGALYHRFPVIYDIAGTRESIAQITPEVLYQCYQGFYNLHNMVLVAVGHFDPQEVLDSCDRLLPVASPFTVERFEAEEPREVRCSLVEKEMDISLPSFVLGFKEPVPERQRYLETSLYLELLLDILTSDVSALYRRLYDAQLINDNFNSEVFTCRGRLTVLFSGESREPKAVAQAVCDEFDRARQEGLDRAAFERSRRAIYGRLVKTFNNVESVGSALSDYFFANTCIYDIIEKIAVVTFDEIQALLETHLIPQYSALSVLWPKER